MLTVQLAAFFRLTEWVLNIKEWSGMEGWRIARSAMRHPEMDAKWIDRQCPFGTSDKRVWLSIIPLLRYYGVPLPFGYKTHEVLAPYTKLWACLQA